MSILLTFVASVILLSAAIYSFFVWLRIRNLGTLQITTSQVAYDEATFGHILTWDKYCFYIHGKPVWLISGEFHYWRLPDRNRWREVLMQYKAAGLNCIRIYFCWAYHSPDQGEYHFDGNRDIEYLMNLCEELELFVLAAPGPYICAETQAGGEYSF
jgi:heme/copper-type cytochrome/quinol oxidase subunit 2